MPRRQAGYTLIELLIVLALIGMLMSLVSLGSAPDPAAKVRRDAERLESLFALAADEAEMRSRTIAWRADDHGYTFLLHGPTGWWPIENDDIFRAREWEAGAVHPTLTAAVRSAVAVVDSSDDIAAPGVVWIEFPRDGLQLPFNLSLHGTGAENGATAPVVLRADGAGRYTVQARSDAAVASTSVPPQ